jgi:hypothetical protein
MPFENNNEAQADKTQDAKPQQGNSAIAQQAWGPQALENKQAANPQDAQQQLNDGLANVGNLYNGFMNGVKTFAQGVEKTTDMLGSAIGAGAQDMAKTAVQGAEAVGKTVDQGVKDLANTASERAQEAGKAINQTVETATKVGGILGNGLAAGVDQFGKSLQQDSTVQATERLVGDMNKAGLRDAEQQRQDLHDLFTDPGKLAVRDLAKGALGVVGFGQGVLNFETKLGDAIVNHPVESLQKAAETAIAPIAFAGKVAFDSQFNPAGLQQDGDQFTKFAKHTTNALLNGADYYVNANEQQRGEVLGEYLAPAIVGAMAGKYVSGELLGAAEKFAAGGAAEDEAALLQNARSVVGKGLEAKEKFDEIDENAAKTVFGKQHESINDLREKLEHVTDPVHETMEGAHHAAKHAVEAVAGKEVAEGADEVTRAAKIGEIAMAGGAATAIAATEGTATHMPKLELPKLEISDDGLVNPNDYIDLSKMSTKELMDLLKNQDHQSETSRWAKQLEEANNSDDHVGPYISEINGVKIQPKYTLC